MPIRKFIMEDNSFPITSIEKLQVNPDEQEVEFVIIPQNKRFYATCDYDDNIVFSDGDFCIVGGNKHNLFDFCKDFTYSCNGEMMDPKVIIAWFKKNFDIDSSAFNKMIETVC